MTISSTPQTEPPYKLEEPSFLSDPKLLFFMTMLVYLCLAGLVFCVSLTYILVDQQDRLIIYDVALVAVLVFLFLINNQLSKFSRADRSSLQRKAQLYTNLLPKEDDTPDRLISVRQKALEYCQELIDDYKKVRKESRNFYYVFQLSTIILSGVTPILVLLDKQIDVPYLKWLPVICPAVAAVVTSIATSFPFQERWLNANKVVEKLEAEQEKFILGVTQPYRAFLIVNNEQERAKKLKLAIENFIIEVNKIHLQQVEAAVTKPQQDEAALEEAASTSSPEAPESTETTPTRPRQSPEGSTGR
jgi:ABC-type multidrug transport system fused ATPase/permease subunit